MFKSTQEQRIEQLEAALRDAVDYLSRLPAVPVTRDKISELQGVLDETVPKKLERERSSVSYTPSGIPIVEVAVLGDRVWVKIPELDQKGDAQAWAHLCRGVCMLLEQRRPEWPLTEREQQLLT